MCIIERKKTTHVEVGEEKHISSSHIYENKEQCM